MNVRIQSTIHRKPGFIGIRLHSGPRVGGGAEGVRTPDLLNAIQALYQLSYDPDREV